MPKFVVVVQRRVEVDAVDRDEAEEVADRVVRFDYGIRNADLLYDPYPMIVVHQKMDDRIADVEAALKVIEYRKQFTGRLGDRGPLPSAFDVLEEVRRHKITPVYHIAHPVTIAHKRVHSWSSRHTREIASRVEVSE